MPQYVTEREGQLAFFDNFRVDYRNNEVLIDNTDGVWKGNLFEFKLSIKDLNKTLLQAIKYLSRMRINGESVPANILLIDLNKEVLYLYHSQDYFDDIHKVYVGAASANNVGFVAGQPVETIDFSDMVGAQKVLTILLENHFMPIRIDESCIRGWAERYYRENPKATKGDFLGDETGSVVSIKGEIREPKHFKGLILPYEGKTNEKFKYLMDCLNDRLKKKDLGAFYTPPQYAAKACELVKMAIDRVPAGNDYIILDRCAGTGNLEQAILDTLGEEAAGHIVCSTYEYYEYKVLVERLGSKVRIIIPPTEALVVYDKGCVMNADAMSEEYINNPLIKQYVDNPKCSIILFENPPYRDVTSNSTGVARSQGSYILDEMSKEVSGATLNELTNRFVWSGLHFYLRQSTDSYIVFSPVKYFKTCHLVDGTFVKGFLFNRAYFHATPSAISCILWANSKAAYEKVSLDIIDIVDEQAVTIGTQIVTKAYKSYSQVLYDKRTFPDDIPNGVCCELDGRERVSDKGLSIKKMFNHNIIGYIRASSFNFDPLSRQLLRCGEYDGHGFFIRNDTFLLKLPLWVAKQIPLDYWYEKDIFATTADGGDAYTKDKDFLKSCLIYTCLSNQNKCLTFDGSDGRHYQNELCFDNGTVASADLKKMQLDDDEKELLSLWKRILAEARETGNCKADWTYGVYQIVKEINTSHKEGSGRQEKIVYDYPPLNGDLDSLRVKLKEYYKSHITEKMFKYELIK